MPRDFGAFAILYTGDSNSPSDTYVEWFGKKIDTDVVGTGSLILALVLFAIGLSLMRRRH